MLKPLDLQTILPRSVELQRVQQTQNTRPLTDQQQFAREMLQRSQLRQDQVQQNDASGENPRVRDENQSKKKRDLRYRRFHELKADEAETEPAEATASDSERGLHIDIKI